MAATFGDLQGWMPSETLDANGREWGKIAAITWRGEIIGAMVAMVHKGGNVPLHIGHNVVVYMEALALTVFKNNEAMERLRGRKLRCSGSVPKRVLLAVRVSGDRRYEMAVRHPSLLQSDHSLRKSHGSRHRAASM